MLKCLCAIYKFGVLPLLKWLYYRPATHTVMASITSEDVAVQLALHSYCVCYPAHVATLYTLQTMTVYIAFADVAALHTLHTVSHCVHYLRRCGCTIYLTHYHSLHCLADVAALYTLHTIIVYIALQLWLHYIHYIQSQCMLPLQVWLHYILYIQSLCVLPLQMWLHYILYIQSLCVLSLQVWLHYILYIVTVCVTFAGVAALYTLHTLCKHYLCRCGYTCARLPCCST